MKDFLRNLFGCQAEDSDYSELKRKADAYDNLLAEKKFEDRKKKLSAIEIGVRVKANETAGFNRGAVGVVKYVEPNGQRVWVLRDGASSDCYYHPEELDVIEA